MNGLLQVCVGHYKRTRTGSLFARLVIIIHYSLQGLQNLGGANIFWENKISEVDFIHFYEN